MTLFSTLLWALSLVDELAMRCFMVRGHCLTIQRDCSAMGGGHVLSWRLPWCGYCRLVFVSPQKFRVLRTRRFHRALAPIGLALGRLGNFINQELWGRPTDVPWAMVFPYDPSGLARHPSQLYQFAMEGLLLFFILYWYTRTPRPRWSSAGLFLWVTAYFDRLPSSSVSPMPT